MQQISKTNLDVCAIFHDFPDFGHPLTTIPEPVDITHLDTNCAEIRKI